LHLRGLGLVEEVAAESAVAIHRVRFTSLKWVPGEDAYAA
jgi:hypothetical protein